MNYASAYYMSGCPIWSIPFALSPVLQQAPVQVFRDHTAGVDALSESKQLVWCAGTSRRTGEFVGKQSISVECTLVGEGSELNVVQPLCWRDGAEGERGACPSSHQALQTSGASHGNRRDRLPDRGRLGDAESAW